MDATSPGYAGIGVTTNCGCHRGPWFGTVPPLMCDFHRNQSVACAPNPPWTAVATRTAGLAFTMPIPDADIDRIAKRVVELLKEAK